MKKFIITTGLCAFIGLSGTAQDIYIRFNKVPATSGIVTGTQSSTKEVGKPIDFDDDGNPTDAYLMEAPTEAGGIYTKEFTLPAGSYEYQAVFADGTGTQGENNAWTLGRPFSVSETTDILFRAKIITVNGSNYIKFLNDAQDLRWSNTTNVATSMLITATPDNEGNVKFAFTYSNYKGYLEACLYPQSSTTQLMADVLPTRGKYSFGFANGKVRWLFTYNRYTLTFVGGEKLVTLLNADSINTGNGFIAAGELDESLGTFSSTTPLSLTGKTTSVSAIIGIDGPAGAFSDNDLLKIAPVDIKAEMYYEVTQGEGEETSLVAAGNALLSTTVDVNTPEYQTEWKLETPVNITNGLTNGTYNLNVWYETVCHGDTIKSTVLLNTTPPTLTKISPFIKENNIL
ncbi:MAG: hypothetical protein LBS07_02950, partial [Prevotellaceae bacterium]|nr:hypothetical protein [Prevotellaceae bacterium]